MSKGDYIYFEYALGLPERRGNLGIIGSKINYSSTEPIFVSPYFFDDILKSHLITNKSAKGYIGKYYVPKLIFDIDKGKNSDEYVYNLTDKFVNKLLSEIKLDQNDIEIWYSGTGYHIYTVNFMFDELVEKAPQKLFNSYKKYFPETDYSFWKSGMIRGNYSVNSKSGLYKNVFNISRFTTYGYKEIMEYCKTPNRDAVINYRSINPSLNPEYPLLSSDVKSYPIGSLDTSKIITCVQKMFNKGEDIGHRHERILRMASAWKRQGVPFDAAVSIIQRYAPSMDRYEAEKYVKSIYDNHYSYSCNDTVMKEFCDSKCIFYNKKDYGAEVFNAKEMEKEFKKFVDSPRFYVNLKDIFGTPDFRMTMGDFVMLIGDTGLNKTALMQNLCINASDFAPILYQSTEFSNMLLYRRFVQIAHNMTREEVEDHYQKHDNTLSNAFDHVHFVRTGTNVSNVEKNISTYFPKIVVIDTVDDLVISGMPAGVLMQERISSELKKMAEKYNTVIIGIHHIDKNSAVDRETGLSRPLTVHSGKGSTGFQQKCDLVLGLQGKQDEVFRYLRVLKGRDDPPFSITFRLNPSTFKMRKI